MRAGLLALLLNLVAASPRVKEEMEKNLLLQELEMGIPPAHLADDPLDNELMMSKMKRGAGLLQPTRMIRIINRDQEMSWNQNKQEMTVMENIFGAISRLTRMTRKTRITREDNNYLEQVSKWPRGLRI